MSVTSCRSFSLGDSDAFTYARNAELMSLFFIARRDHARNDVIEQPASKICHDYVPLAVEKRHFGWRDESLILRSVDDQRRAVFLSGENLVDAVFPVWPINKKKRRSFGA